MSRRTRSTRSLRSPQRLAGALLALSPAFALTACDTGDGKGNSGQVDSQQAVLRAFESCEGLTEYFKAEAREAMLRGGYAHGPVFGSDDGVGAPSVDGNGAEGGGQGEGTGGDRSGTNNQEAGVDEADLVKDDGTFLYVANGDRVFIHAAADLSLVSQINVAGGQPQLVLDGDRLGLIYQVWGGVDALAAGLVGAPARFEQTSFTVFEVYDVADRAAPRLVKRSMVEGGLVASRLIDGTLRAVVQFDGIGAVYQRIDGSNFDGGFGDPVPQPVDGAGPSNGSSGAGSGGSDSGGDPDEPPQAGGAPEPEPGAFGMRRFAQAANWQGVVEDAIDGSTLTDWVPYRIDVAEGRAEATPVTSCQAFHRPGEAAGHGVTAVISINLREPGAAFVDPAVVTGAGVVYVSPSALYLTTTNHASWGWGGRGGVAVGGDVAVADGGDSVSNVDEGGSARETEPIDARSDGQAAEEIPNPEGPDATANIEPEAPEREATQIHKLSFAGGADSPAYVGSGRVFGTPLNQFSLGEHAGNLRIATTETRITDWTTTNHLFVLGAGGESGLEVLGQVSDLAEGERIYAVRFMGPIGFMVTFRQVDPLFTFDLSDPAAPQMLGELKIPGFSTYLHPMGADHLIGIGQSATEEGRITGMQLSLFDVSDLANPVQAHVQLLGEGYSEALYNHLAFTYFAPRNLLAVPVQRWNEGNLEDDREWREETGIELFNVSAEAGFESRGFVQQDTLDVGYLPAVSRTLFIGDTLYALSPAGITAYGIDDLSLRAQAAFPQQNHDDGIEPGRDGAEPTPEPDFEAGGN